MEPEDVPHPGKRRSHLETIILMFYVKRPGCNPPKMTPFWNQGFQNCSSACSCTLRTGLKQSCTARWGRTFKRKYDSNDEMMNFGMIHWTICAISFSFKTKPSWCWICVKVRGHLPSIFLVKSILKKHVKSTINIYTYVCVIISNNLILQYLHSYTNHNLK